MTESNPGGKGLLHHIVMGGTSAVQGLEAVAMEELCLLDPSQAQVQPLAL